MAAAYFACPARIEQVRPELNLAGRPSRACVFAPGAPTLRPPNYGTPDASQKISESENSMGVYQFSFSNGIGVSLNAGRAQKTKTPRRIN